MTPQRQVGHTTGAAIVRAKEDERVSVEAPGPQCSLYHAHTRVQRLSRSAVSLCTAQWLPTVIVAALFISVIALACSKSNIICIIISTGCSTIESALRFCYFDGFYSPKWQKLGQI